MESILITSINKVLTKKNFFETYLEVLKINKNRNHLNSHELLEFRKDLRRIRRFLASNLQPNNISYIKHYYKEIMRLEQETTNFKIKKLVNEI